MLKEFEIEPLLKDKVPHQTKAVVAMSGGVDSSVAAVLLHRLGYQVIGVTLQLYGADGNSNTRKKGVCCAGQDIYDAKRVAEGTGFPHYILNYEEIFKKEVIESFAQTYIQGKTPIPCIKCNQTVKFRDLLQVTRNLGADVLITGHYVRRLEKNGEVKLCRGIDKSKDQSYFLFATTKEQLKLLRFPLGGFYKCNVRKLARYFSLPISEKPDSQDICFVSENYSKTIAKLAPQSIQKGKIVDVNGKVLGEHNGIVNFTVGQRKGLGIAYSEPLYVVRINTKNNEIVVGPVNALMQRKILVKELNWLEQPKKGMEVTVKLRSLHSGSLAKIYPAKEQNKAYVILNDDYFSISPGQACVAYKDEQVIGGGWICS
ncbi:tRNA 2-thiouridine(34) synthase MnmA [Wolbachia endosymbiont of Brugia malayi]|uniref:tRNA-specific 2-thiouridylase MnmA n=1 Tax=Wolbachia sp. subsp. Brugia malayi (strain TRS) TaxID=292805 RepID=MNMA_WOLTR|nr:tRNA 2-thiouridine(34) synthase MnmA [Wolbachia endosymbiont of Brugia malayi]Q5GTC8.2 RecName: Full=tRNA-specific 2-thiouridylase MnmA [Wolbachia endosymbiont strain TRS of Brugia malayi]QCB61724.1 tRNA 2-thiouridine(34) synthase MnmA [Wolbachia endosymbiont of Brugia malayi]